MEDKAGTTSTRGDRISGSLYGGAIGDALGAAFEFVGGDRIENHLGASIARDFEIALPGSLLYPRAAGLPTDDTAMAISIARTILRCDDPKPVDFAEQFLADLRPNRDLLSDMFWKGGPGGATVRALRKLESGVDPSTCGAAEDGGNGAAMRAHPIGFLKDRNEVLRLAALQARVTHGHPSAIAAAQAVSVLVFDALAGEPPVTAVPAGVDDPEFVAAWLRQHVDLKLVEGRLPRALRDAKMSGWETVATAHAITLCLPNDAGAAIGAAAASGADTDTVASIVGAIVGARHGYKALPKHLVHELKGSGYLEAVLTEMGIASLTRGRPQNTSFGPGGTTEDTVRAFVGQSARFL